MSAFALDRSYSQLNFAEISVDELEMITGGSGGGGRVLQCVLGTVGGAGMGGLTGAAAGSAVPAIGTLAGGVAGAIFGGAVGAAASCFG